MKKSLFTTIYCLTVGGLFAAPTTIYVHGFHFSIAKTETAKTCQGKSTCESYWGVQDNSTPVVHTGYDGRYNPTVAGAERGSSRLLANLNAHCRRDRGQSCRIVNHSMGGLTTGFVLATYNRSNIYNVLYVTSMVSAEGGSELANIGSPVLTTLNIITLGLSNFFLNFPDAVSVLKTSAARAAYDHNLTNGTPFYHMAGNTPEWYIDWIFPGKHDTVLAMHSTCSYRDVKDFTRCGGESVTSGIWPFRSTKYYNTHSGHYVHPRYSVTGLGIKHLDYPNRSDVATAAP
jgi:hypothetical protein